jgi:hypothetical protein
MQYRIGKSCDISKSSVEYIVKAGDSFFPKTVFHQRHASLQSQCEKEHQQYVELQKQHADQIAELQNEHATQIAQMRQEYVTLELQMHEKNTLVDSVMEVKF